MTKNQQVLFGLCALAEPVSPAEDHRQFGQQVLESIRSFGDRELGQLFFDVAFLATGMKFLKEEHWLQSRELKVIVPFAPFIAKIFRSELAPVRFLERLFLDSSLIRAEKIGEKAEFIGQIAIAFIRDKPFAGQALIVAEALRLMDVSFDLETRLQSECADQGRHLGLSLYRAFDRLDEIFCLSYGADAGMKYEAHHNERIYEGAGVGVQSSYSTVFAALRHLAPAPGSRVIDLGSGYGRVGLVMGLLRPDLNFVGYEFVRHRVDSANTSSENFGLQGHVSFQVQDLAHPSFQIPDADIFYMYDPFTAETYRHVLDQLVSISHRRSISIATKGNAKDWLLEVASQHRWAAPQEFDGGNLCIFKS